MIKVLCCYPKGKTHFGRTVNALDTNRNDNVHNATRKFHCIHSNVINSGSCEGMNHNICSIRRISISELSNPDMDVKGTSLLNFACVEFVAMISGSPPLFWSRKGEKRFIHYQSCYLRIPRSLQWLFWIQEKAARMASSGSSGTSDPDPILPLETEVRSLRRNLRKQGRKLKLIDAEGGKRIELLEEEAGKFRPQLEAAMSKLESGVLQALEALNARVGTLEQKVEALMQTRPMEWDDAQAAAPTDLSLNIMKLD